MLRKFNSLSDSEKKLIEKVYAKYETRKEAQQHLSEIFEVDPRTIRDWAYKLEIGRLPKNLTNPSKVMVYDIETSRATFKLFWTGKQYVSVNNMTAPPKIISVCWKWLGEDEIYSLTWDENQCDKEMLSEFIEHYNSADMVIGQNNDKFDNRWVNARIAKHELDVNTHVKSFDIMKQNKKMFRLPSYSMAFLCEYFDVEQKLHHEGIKMWDMIEDGTREQQEEYLAKMIEYNRGDIVSTEALYYRLRKYYGHKLHFGVLNDEPKWTSPSNGSYNVSLYKTTVTPAGTIQRIMVSNDDGVQYKINNKVYMDYLDWKIKNTDNGE